MRASIKEKQKLGPESQLIEHTFEQSSYRFDIKWDKKIIANDHICVVDSGRDFYLVIKENGEVTRIPSVPEWNIFLDRGNLYAILTTRDPSGIRLFRIDTTTGEAILIYQKDKYILVTIAAMMASSFGLAVKIQIEYVFLGALACRVMTLKRMKYLWDKTLAYQKRAGKK